MPNERLGLFSAFATIGRWRKLRPNGKTLNTNDFFGELNRRNVIRVDGLYLVGAWLLAQMGWPAGCRPLGETDFECGIDAAPLH